MVFVRILRTVESTIFWSWFYKKIDTIVKVNVRIMNSASINNCSKFTCLRMQD